MSAVPKYLFQMLYMSRGVWRNFHDRVESVKYIVESARRHPLAREPKGNSMNNAWSIALPRRNDIFSIPGVNAYLRAALPLYLEAIGAPASSWLQLVEETVALANRPGSDDDYRQSLHRLLHPEKNQAVITLSRNARARTVLEQIKTHIAGNTVLDLGAGDGAIGKLLQSECGKEVICADVFRSEDIDRLDLPFYAIDPVTNRVAIATASFDTLLLASVVHHADNPEALLAEARRLLKPGGKLILVEALLDPQALSQGAGYADNAITQQFLALNDDARLATTCFMDDLANTVGWSPAIHHMIPCPCNFNSVANWKAYLLRTGFTDVKIFALGVDQPLGGGMFHGLVKGTLSQ